MAEHDLVLRAAPRTEIGSRNSRRLRRRGMIPAVIYGHGEENLHVQLEEREFRKNFEAGHKIYSLEIGDKRETGLVKEVQYDPLGEKLLHVDFARISLTEQIEMTVPIVAFGAARGISGGGILDQELHSIVVEGSAASIPEEIRVSIAELEVGGEIRVRDLQVPEGCRFVTDGDTLVFAIHEAKEEVVEEEVAAPEEPEVFGSKKEEPEEESG